MSYLFHEAPLTDGELRALRELIGPHRYVQRTVHPCGCITVFDTEEWRSVARARCDDHQRAEAER